MKEINSLYYKLLKTTVGPVFNIKHSIAEVIVGLPPITIQNKVNQIKHYLKIIFNDVPNDPLKKSIQRITAHNPPPDLQIALRGLYKFLKWKLQISPAHFSEMDKHIIDQNNYSSFHLLSQSCGEYTKPQIAQYTELLWEESIRNEFLLEGLSIVPRPSCKTLQLSSELDRKTEVKIMSMFYENNLLNSFLYRRNLPEVPSPICVCGKEEQTAYHILTRCEMVKQELRHKVVDIIQSQESVGESTVVLLNLSRDNKFINILSQIIVSHGNIIRTEINL